MPESETELRAPYKHRHTQEGGSEAEQGSWRKEEGDIVERDRSERHVRKRR